MQNEIDKLLNDLLIAWHKWSCGYKHTGGIGSSPMFKDARSSRGWDTVADIVDSEIDADTMQSVNFHVLDMEPVHRTALQLQARNLHTGNSVWCSPRLPQDPQERATILVEARNKLLRRLLAAGVV